MIQLILILTSFLLVAFGQPAWVWWFGLIASAVGYTLFFEVLLEIEKKSRRFWLAVLWFSSVQLVQLSWFATHPYAYIYIVYFVMSFLIGLQFGVLSLFIQKKLVRSLWGIAMIAGLWTIMEWSRLFFIAGHTWNPIGLALTGSLYPLQIASIAGIFGCSFWVMFVNLLALRAWQFRPKMFPAITWACMAVVPYLFGFIHLQIHKESFAQKNRDENSFLHVVLVQTAFPVEEAMGFAKTEELIRYVLDEWRQILKITKKQYGKKIDLIALPEFTVPFGTYSFVYPYERVRKIFLEVFGPESLAALPQGELPYVKWQETPKGIVWMVNNAFWTQAIANLFQANVVIGLEDADDLPSTGRNYYSAALYFKHQDRNVERYEKRVLVPMGEYIPLTILKDLAASYGVTGSFTPGAEAKVMTCKHVPFGVSICYEETFGHIMRENRQKGAELLVNLTSDVWYPNSRLPRQHLDHARLRTVENGIPLIRACNTGITGAIDCFGQVVAELGDPPEQAEWVADSLFAKVPTYHYHTPYSRFGDFLIIALSSFLIVIGFVMTRGKLK